MSNDDARDELAWLLHRAGITLPPGRIDEVTVEYEMFKTQLALVNAPLTAEDEPSPVFRTSAASSPAADAAP